MDNNRTHDIQTKRLTYTGEGAEKALRNARELGQCLSMLYQVRDMVSEKMEEVYKAREFTFGDMDADFNDHLFKCIDTIKTIISDNIENGACMVVNNFSITNNNCNMDNELKQVRTIGVSEDTANLLDAKRELDKFYHHILDMDSKIYHSSHEDELSELFVKMNALVADMIAAQVCMNSSESDYTII